jgi:hypothetical protein
MWRLLLSLHGLRCMKIGAAEIDNGGESSSNRGTGWAGGAMVTLLEGALAAPTLILASSGAHAKESWQKIVDRKGADIAKVNHTIWVVISNAARPDAVQSFCNDHAARYVLFVSRARDAKASVGTIRDQQARHYSADGRTWTALDRGLSPVTGDIKRSTTGFWFDALEEVPSGSLDLDSFTKHQDNQTLTRFWPSDSAYPVRSRTGGYHILAAGRLASPFAVWLRP